MDKEYYVTTAASRTVIHRDADCHILEAATDVRSATKAEIDRYPVCKVCSGERSIRGGDKSHYNSLKEAAE